MIPDIFTILWVFLPMGVANMTPVFTAHTTLFSFLYRPIDMGMSYKGVRIFGDHKTWLGLISGMLAGGIVAIIQYQIYLEYPSSFSFLPAEYHSLSPVFFGMWTGLGALVGDAVKSYFKRRRGVPPGMSWVPYDQLDYVLGGILFSSILMHLSILQYALALLIFFLLHLGVSALGYIVGLKEKII